MKKDLRFRIWNKATKSFERDEKGDGPAVFNLLSFSEYLQRNAIDNIDCLESLEYTGCDDSLGNEIYEGDILEYSKNGTRVGYVDFIGGIFLLDYLDGTDDELGYLSAEGLTVIGNIMENASLLNDNGDLLK